MNKIIYIFASFIQMPEEQAFAVLVKIMYDYQLRDMFMNKFIELHVKFYQLERLIEVRVHSESLLTPQISHHV